MAPKKCCNVCCDVLKKPVACGFCDYETCGSCASRFIVEGTIDPKCMNCKKPWARKFLTDSFGKSFMSKKYKEKRENDLFETEKALMPETQEFATRKKRMDSINKELYTLQARIRELKIQKRILEAGGDYTKRPEEKKTDVSIKCPIGECRGFVNSFTLQCGVCDGKLCKECREQVFDGIEHTCNPDTVETVKLLKKDTKNCPSCKTLIHKIEGCDQMYCTQCHTAFSWRTGEVVIGERIHNPHYFEYLRATRGDLPREMGDIPCGGIPTERDARKFWQNKPIMDRMRLLTHVERVEFRNYTTDRIANNRDLRIKYLNNEITEDQFKRSVQRRAKDVEKRREILAVLNTLVVAGSDILRNLIANDDPDMCITSFDTLREFVNTSISEISKLYNCVVPFITDNMYISSKKF